MNPREKNILEQGTGNREQGTGIKSRDKEKFSSKFSPPSLDEVKAYCLEKGYSVSAHRFIAYYESNGWKVGKNPMRSWKSAISGWHYRDNEKAKTSDKPNKFAAYDKGMRKVKV